MSKRKQCLKFYLSVEGQTEQQYFRWLQQEINADEQCKYVVSLDVKVDENPLHYVKNLNPLASQVAHIFDYEDSSGEQQTKFRNILDNMARAGREKCIEYKLGYSNLTFELWIILHKTNCNKRFGSRKDYLKVINDTFNQRYLKLSVFKQEKNFEKILKQITLSDVKIAVKRAETIERNNNNNCEKEVRYRDYRYRTNNPALSIHTIVDDILKQAYGERNNPEHK